ncbi:MAG: ABC transporter ATP-binding protein [Clostridiales bacterium]|nr:ABC transporter ATP-binding protein [Clostridiales bacterium]
MDVPILKYRNNIMSKNNALKWIMKNSKSQNKKIIVLLIANALFSALSIVFALFIKEIIDSAVAQNLNRLISFASAIIVVVILQFGFRIFTNLLTENIKNRLEIGYKSSLFSSILRKKHDKITTFHSGELMTRLTSDVSVVSEGVSTILPTIISAVTRLVLAVVTLIIIDWVFAIAFTVAGLSVFLVLGFLRGKLKSYHKKSQETDGKIRSFMQECIENILAVKVFSVNSKIQKKSDDLQETNYSVKMKRQKYGALGHAMYNFIFSAGYLFALIYGAIKMLNSKGLFTYGSLSAILQLVNNVQVPFISLSNVVPKYYSMLASAERIMEMENIENEPEIQQVDREKIYKKLKGIVVDGVDFTYDRDSVLKDASIYINKGDFVAITGASGVGKSTLIKLLLGVYSLDNGSVYFDIQDEKMALDNSTRSMFSYVPQGNMIFSGTIKDNITFINSDASEEEIERAINISMCKEFIETLPKGLETVIGENGVGLSEGQVQRIAIARAILTKAPILLLDEATSALDENTEKIVLDNLKGIDGATIIIVSHKKAALSICDKNIQIKDKKIKNLVKKG